MENLEKLVTLGT